MDDKDKKIKDLEEQVKRLEQAMLRLSRQVQQHHGRIVRTDERLRHINADVSIVKRKVSNV